MKSRMFMCLALTMSSLGCVGDGSDLFSRTSSSGVCGGDTVSSTDSTTSSEASTSVSTSVSSSSGQGSSSSSSSTGGAPGCTPGAAQCDGLDVQTCDGSGEWQVTTTCPFVCSSGACAGECSPGSKQCDGVTPQECDANGQWVDGPDCDFVCSAGTCTGACTPDATQCNGKVVQTCDDEGLWTDTQVCPFVCGNGACGGVCTPGAQQCAGNSVQTCNAQGQWTTGASCPFLCSAGACTGVCTPGDVKCSGNGTQTCNAAGQWAATVTCPAPAHASPTCGGNGVCGWTCSAGFDNCDGNAATGCEANLADPSTCGSCGNACSSANGAASCSMGSCGIACNQGFGNCNGGAGCETMFGTVQNCTGCGDACTAPANALSTCEATGCDFVCLPGYEDCDGNPANGCEVDTESSLSNCGGCGTTCVGVGATCSAGECSGLVRVTSATNVTSMALGTPFAMNEVYYTTLAGSVQKVIADGGTATTLALGQTSPRAIQTDGLKVFWSNTSGAKAIRAINTTGGPITDLVTGYGPVEMTHDGQSLFFTTRTGYDPCYCSDNSGTPIYQLGLNGGAPTVINPQVNSQVFPGWPGLVVTGNYVQRIQWNSSGAISPVIGQHKTDTNDFYGGGSSGVYIGASFESFTSGKLLVKNDQDDMAMFTVLQTSGPAFVKMHSGQSASLIALAPALIVRGIAIDGNTLYVIGRFSSTSADRLIGYPLNGGMPTYLLDNMYNASNILVDDTHVYLTVDGTKVGSGAPVIAPMVVRFEK